MFHSTCPNCEKKLTIPDRFEGENVQCKHCQSVIEAIRNPETANNTQEETQEKDDDGNDPPSEKTKNRSDASFNRNKKDVKRFAHRKGKNKDSWKLLAIFGLITTIMATGGMIWIWQHTQKNVEKRREFEEKTKKQFQEKYEDRLAKLQSQKSKLKEQLQTEKENKKEKKKQVEDLKQKVAELEVDLHHVREEKEQHKKKLKSYQSALKNREKNQKSSEKPKNTTEIVQSNLPSVALIKTDSGSGAGFFVTEDGFLITNFHVISGASEIRVVAKHGEEQNTYDGQPYAVHAKRDLALLKINPTQDLPHFNLDQEIDLKTGNKVIAIGNPGMGKAVLPHTVSTGIVSNVKRSLEGKSFIQTSTPINPGNSGGPLINMNGKLVGVVTVKATKVDNIGFAIPRSIVRNLYQNRNSTPYKVDGNLSEWMSEHKPDSGITPHYQTSNLIDIEGKISDFLIHDQNKHLYALDFENNAILSVSIADRTVKEKEFIGSDPYLIKKDPRDQAVWVVNKGSSEILKVTVPELEKERTFQLDALPIDITILRNAFWYVSTKKDLRLFLKRQKKDYKALSGFHSIEQGKTPDQLLVSSKKGLKSVRTNFMKNVLQKKHRVKNSRKYHEDHRFRRKIRKKLRKALHKGIQDIEIDLPDSSSESKFIVQPAHNRIYFRRHVLELNNPSNVLGKLKRNPFSRKSNRRIRAFMKKYSLDQISRVSPDGKWAVDGTHIYRTKDFTVQRELPIPSVKKAFTSDSEELWLYDPFNDLLVPIPIKESTNK